MKMLKSLDDFDTSAIMWWIHTKSTSKTRGSIPVQVSAFHWDWLHLGELVIFWFRCCLGLFQVGSVSVLVLDPNP